MRINVDECASLWYKSTPHFYFLAHAALRNCIAHYTYFANHEIVENQHLLLVPDVAGCIVLSEVDHTLECDFWGPTTNCVKVTADKERIHFQFFIEFHPAGAYSLFHMPQHDLLNKRLSLDTLFPDLTKQIQQLYERVASLDEFIKGLDLLLLRSFIVDTTCVQRLQQTMFSNQNMKELSLSIGYSERHIQRMFQEQIGTSMKAVQRIERINRAVKYFQQTTKRGSEIAQLCGYYDQAHFIHDFKLVCGVTPRMFQQQMSVFYNENFKF